MICPNCHSHMRLTDIENTIFNFIDGVIVGNVNCRICKKDIPTKQVIAYIPIEPITRRKGDQHELEINI